MSQQGHTPAHEIASLPQRRRWVHRHPRWTLLGMNVLGLSIILLIAEVALRAWGFQAGSLEMGWLNFHPLEPGQSLQVYDHYFTDAEGVFKAARDNPDRGITINPDGFRGPAFAPTDSTRLKIMLIGDSFVWGASATPMDSAFADRLRSPAWQVMNMGIPGTGPDQYARIAELYIPRLRPDVVCVFFYLGNDQMPLPIDLQPHQPRFHITNVGWLDPFGDGAYIGDAAATYAYCKERYLLPQTTLFNRLCAQTVIGTFVWRGLVRMGWIGEHYRSAIQTRVDASAALAAQGPYARPHLLRLQAICQSAGIPLRLFLIPKHNAVAPPVAEDAAILQGLEPIFPTGLTQADYNPRPDGHFNNAGHRKMAALVAAEIHRLFPSLP